MGRRAIARDSTGCADAVVASTCTDAASQWQDIITEACKAAVILFILERLFLTRHASWLEARVLHAMPACSPPLTRLASTQQQDHIDYLSLQARSGRRCMRRSALTQPRSSVAQALLYKRAGMTMTKQVMVILMHSKRLADTS